MPQTESEKRADVLVAEVPKNAREVWRVTLGQFGGHNLGNVRAWVPGGGKDGGDVPTKNGLALRVEQLPAMAAALRAAYDEAVRLGLVENGERTHG